MQSYVSMPRSAGIKFIACLKNMAQMDIAERRTSQDGKIRRRFEGEIIEFAVQQLRQIWRKNGDEIFK